MAAVKYDARAVVFQILDTSSGLYVAIGGIDTFTKGRSSKNTDTTTFSSVGMSEQEIMERTETMKLEGFRLKDLSSGALDPGQLLVETLAEQVGDASVSTFRFASPGDTTYKVWQATAEMGDEGGGNNDKVGWATTLTRSGPSSTAARP